MLLRCLSVWLHCLLLQESFWLRILLLPLKWHTVSESIVPGGKRRETKRTIDSNVFLLQEDVTTRTVSATDAAKVLTQHKGNCAEQDITSEICFSGKMSWDFPLFPRILVQSIEWMFIDRTQVSHSLSQSLSQSLSLHIFILRHKERPQDWYETKAKSMKRKKGEVIQAGRSVSFVSLMCEDEGGGGRESTAKTVNVLCSQKTGMKPRKSVRIRHIKHTVHTHSNGFDVSLLYKLNTVEDERRESILTCNQNSYFTPRQRSLLSIN